MPDPASPPRSRLFLNLAGLALLVLGALGGWMFERQRTAGAVSGGDRAAMEQVVHDYLLAHPEVLPEAMDRLRDKETQKQLAGIGGKLYEAYPGAVMGNPQGTVTLVAFSDFACGYCRQSEPALAALIAENPDLKVVVRHLPIIAPTSPAAAAMGLAAAEQGKYSAFHSAMFSAGRTDPASVEAAARLAGLDLDRARAAAVQPKVQAELEANVGFARTLGFNGTPVWIAGDQILQGAVGKDALTQAVAKARKARS